MFEPGSASAYGNPNFVMLGQIVAEVSGQPYIEYVKEHILTPLGMEDTAPNLILCPSEDEHDTPREADYLRVHQAMAKPYQVDRDFKVIDGDYQTVFSPAAGLISTVQDLALFDIALDSGDLLDQETKEAMFEPLVSTYGDSDELMYGLGWYHQLYNGVDLLWHTGRWSPSISALYLKVPKEDLSFFENVKRNRARL